MMMMRGFKRKFLDLRTVVMEQSTEGSNLGMRRKQTGRVLRGSNALP